VARWLATGRPPNKTKTIDAVHSIITLDSPIRGLTDVKTAAQVHDAAGLVGINLSGLVDLVTFVAANDAGQDLQNTDALGILNKAPGSVDVYSLANDSDLFVRPCDAAVLGEPGPRSKVCLAAAVANLTLLAATSTAVSAPGGDAAGWPLRLLALVLTLGSLLSAFALAALMLRPSRSRRPHYPPHAPRSTTSTTPFSAGL
jgi:hypothetical protein